MLKAMCARLRTIFDATSIKAENERVIDSRPSK